MVERPGVMLTIKDTSRGKQRELSDWPAKDLLSLVELGLLLHVGRGPRRHSLRRTISQRDCRGKSRLAARLLYGLRPYRPLRYPLRIFKTCSPAALAAGRY